MLGHYPGSESFSKAGLHTLCSPVMQAYHIPGLLCLSTVMWVVDQLLPCLISQAG